MTLTAQELKTKMDAGDAVQVIDVRSCSEHASGHIPGAVNIPMDQIESRLADLNHRGPVVLACQSGQRAEMTCNLLTGRHPELLVLDGGTEAWINSGYGVVASSRSRWSVERQVRLTVGILLLTSITLALTVNLNWLFLAGFLGAGLTFSGLTDFCGMAFLFAKMPWNQPKSDGAKAGARAEA